MPKQNITLVLKTGEKIVMEDVFDIYALESSDKISFRKEDLALSGMGVNEPITILYNYMKDNVVSFHITVFTPHERED